MLDRRPDTDIPIIEFGDVDYQHGIDHRQWGQRRDNGHPYRRPDPRRHNRSSPTAD
ncbi:MULTISPECIES: hypothetical protein [Actinomycetes]|uniref:hypothetical protein n=1 Tax=Actinomycetes TaxID=1760 RepID=UPI000A4F0D7E|nr:MULTISPECIES: hypothetical protein [Actinomycetes]